MFPLHDDSPSKPPADSGQSTDPDETRYGPTPPTAADPDATRYSDAPPSPGAGEAATIPPSGDPAATRYPAAPADSETATLPPGSPSSSPAAGTFVLPGYEILGELGRGGMGVVYKARQTKLNRLVALKMILSGAHAGTDDLERFRREAEAVARLQHPNIVQIHEVGEQDGLPFFSLEFCSGGNLERRLNGTPLPPKEAARLIETLARAIHAAHLQHVIHRDLKPANVLLAADGTLKITDFGLAKTLDEAGQTQSGAIMGTPSYMAPEQAGGKSKEIGPAADVYALGAILYECLTGRPPFKAATPLDTILQVVADDPVPPRQLQSKTPRDLETICLKCLQKEPRKRYGSGEELAEDLRRFQASEPITARPVGGWERAVKWVRRRPAVAGFMALFVVTLLAGASVSTYLAAVANDRAEKAEKSDKATNAALQRVEEEQRKTAAALGQVEEGLAVGFLRPLGPNRDIADPIEMMALGDLAALPKDRDRVRLLFLERGLSGPQAAEQLDRRADLTTHAVVGLDRGRRDQVVKLLLLRLRDDGTDLRVRTACASLGAALPTDDAELVSLALDPLLKSIAEVDMGAACADHAAALQVIAGRMDKEEAGAAAMRLLNAKFMIRDSEEFPALGGILEAFAARMGEKEAGAAAPKLLGYMALLADSNADWRHITNAFRVMGARLGREDAAAAAVTILGKLSRKPRPTVVRNYASALEAVAGRMEEGEARQAAAAAAADILTSMDQEDRRSSPYLERGNTLLDCALALEAVAGRMEEGEARQAAAAAAGKILRAIDVTSDHPGISERFLELMELADAFRAVAGKEEPNEARKGAAVAAAKILDAMLEKHRQANELSGLVRAFRAVADLQSPDAAGAMATKLSAAIAKTEDPDEKKCYSSALTVVAGGLGDREAAATATNLLGAMAMRVPDDTSDALVAALRSVAGRLARADAAATAAKALDAMTRATNAGIVWAEAAAFDAVADALDKDEAEKGAAAAAACILNAMEQAKERDDRLYYLCRALRAVAARLDGAAAASAVRRLEGVLARLEGVPAGTDKPTVQQLWSAFGAVASRCERGEGHKGATVAKILRAMTGPEDDKTIANAFFLPDLAEAFGAVGGELDAEEAGAAAAAARRYMTSMMPVGSRAPRQTTMQSPRQTEIQYRTLWASSLKALVGKLGRHELVSLLKHPACVGDARDVLLNCLGRQASRRFRNVWELVDWLEANDPEIDVSSPPAREAP